MSTPSDDPQMLSDLGLFARMDALQARLLDDEALLNDATAVFKLQDVHKITAYVAQQLLNRFVPSYLTFVLEDELGSDRPHIIAFHHMKPFDTPLVIESLEPFRHFFSLSPQSVDFRVFEYMVGRAAMTDPFKEFLPAKVIPLLGLEGVYGFIIVGEKILGEEYSAHEIAYLDRLIQFVSISFQNALHFKRAIVDLKTELYNHSFFMKRLEEELARLRRYRSRTTLLMLDVDHFKKFNDTHGHLAGDAVLKEVSRAIRESIRLEDLAARFGGEEFSVLLIQCDPAKGFLISERIREAIAGRKVVYGTLSLSVTVSIGVAHASTDGNVPHASLLIERADQALYAAKRAGRNRTSVHDPEAAEQEAED